MAILNVLKAVNLLKIKNSEIEKALLWMEKINKKNLPIVNLKNNPAKKMAKELLGKVPVLVGAEFLKGNLHTLRNQLNETSKLYSSYLFLPDLNHHAMEGLLHPKTNSSYLSFLFFSSDLYGLKISKRLKLTKELVWKNKINVLEYKLKGEDKISQSFELLQFGAWLTYYLAMLYNLDPVKIPFVEWFKERIK
jgi:glucose/mannose-6-phosphate isomerase